MQIRWAPAAASDILAIAEHLQKEHSLWAQSTVSTLFQATESLQQFPYRGRVGRLSGTHELVVPGLPFVIVYRIQSQTVEIARILHGAQNWPR